MEIECGFIQSCLNWNMYCCFSFVAVSHSLNAIYRKSMFNAIEKYVFHFLELAIWFVCLSIFSVFFPRFLLCLYSVYYCSKFLHFLFRKFYVDFPILLIESEMTHKKLCPILFIPPQKTTNHKTNMKFILSLNKNALYLLEPQ